jgi:hypothetical protein
MLAPQQHVRQRTHERVKSSVQDAERAFEVKKTYFASKS